MQKSGNATVQCKYIAVAHQLLYKILNFLCRINSAAGLQAEIP